VLKIYLVNALEPGDMPLAYRVYVCTTSIRLYRDHGGECHWQCDTVTSATGLQPRARTRTHGFTNTGVAAHSPLVGQKGQLE
jgi:hypothetical protein